ncbi:DUF5996 family protein [Planococcus maritimus]|uniref:DUF5996 family protein n=1 Tax=Planococcus maritimus TaxID=192421 RepID=UPI00201E1B86|nr:DUF5996 family protein [Planococcus maritimus]
MDVIKHSEWADTKFTLHLLSQILGKIKLETAQQEPQWAHVTLAITPNGFTTGLLFYEDQAFQVDLDIYESRIFINVEGNVQAVPIETAKPIKTYFKEIFEALASKNIQLGINPKPQEMPYKTNLNEDDTPLTFNWEQAIRGLKLFHFAAVAQLKFIGPLRARKMKPALFWGTFDVSSLVLPGIREPHPEDKVIQNPYSMNISSNMDFGLAMTRWMCQHFSSCRIPSSTKNSIASAWSRKRRILKLR